MSKLHCEVIGDLLPSYVDGSCSEQTKALVDEHIADCEACRLRMGNTKEPQDVSERADAKAVDLLKKLKTHITNKHFLFFALLCALIVVGIGIIIAKRADVPIGVYYVILPVVTMSAYFLHSQNPVASGITRFTAIAGSIGSIMLIYSIVLEFFAIQWVKRGTFAFVAQTGPFIYYQFLMIALAHAGIFLGTLWNGSKTQTAHPLLLDLSATGCCLALAFISIIQQLDSPAAFAAQRGIALLVLITQSILLAVLLFFLNRKKTSHPKTPTNEPTD